MEWISVKDRLRESGQKVILFSNGIVQEEIFDYDEDDFAKYWDRSDMDEVAPLKQTDFWIPLPDPPLDLKSSPPEIRSMAEE